MEPNRDKKQVFDNQSGALAPLTLRDVLASQDSPSSLRSVTSQLPEKTLTPLPSLVQVDSGWPWVSVPCPENLLDRGKDLQT